MPTVDTPPVKYVPDVATFLLIGTKPSCVAPVRLAVVLWYTPHPSELPNEVLSRYMYNFNVTPVMFTMLNAGDITVALL